MTHLDSNVSWPEIFPLCFANASLWNHFSLLGDKVIWKSLFIMEVEVCYVKKGQISDLTSIHHSCSVNFSFWKFVAGMLTDLNV